MNLTQAALAAAAGVGITALRTAESGHGRFSTFSRLLDALALELRGRTLAAGPIRPALAAARQKRKQSRRDIAKALGVSRNTLAALETGTGLLSLLEAYGGAVGAGLHLAAVDDERTFYTHASNSSVHHSWETPPSLAGLLMQASGGFDLDPCAASKDRRRVRVAEQVGLHVKPVIAPHGLRGVSAVKGDAAHVAPCDSFGIVTGAAL